MLKTSYIERIKLGINLIIRRKINFRKVVFLFCENFFENFSFIQIGAFDGKSHDFLFKYITESKLPKFGILIEPVGEYYEKLKWNYFQVSGLYFENVAIHNEKKSVIIYKIKNEFETQVRDYVIGCASIFENHFKKHKVKDTYIEEIRVPALSLNELIEKYQIYQYNLLQIDTEGYDGKIILNLELTTYKFDIIKFEHINLSIQEIKQVKWHLLRQFYIVGKDKDDLIAIKINVFIKFLFLSK